MNWGKVWLISSREFLYNFTRKSYLLTAFGIPLLIAGISYFVGQLAAESESNIDEFTTVGYVDLAGVLPEPNPDFPRYVPHETQVDALNAFNAQTIRAYFVIPEDYLIMGQVSYYSDKGMREALRSEFQDFLRASLAGDNPAAERITQPIDLEIQLFGEDRPLSTEAAILRFGLPIALGFLFIFNILITSQFLMTGVVEEKETRILEILATSCRPIELMTGKVLGLGGLALVQIAFWLVVGLFVGAATGRLDTLQEAHFEPGIIGLAILYFTLTFLMFAGIMVAIGAIASAEQESRQFAAVFIVLSVLPVSWGMPLFLEKPDSPVVAFLSLFPLTSPMSMMILIGVGEAETWQVALSLILLVITIAFVLWLAGRVFRIGLLLTGQRLSPRRLMKLLKG